jgi:N-methylhydantoinase B
MSRTVVGSTVDPVTLEVVVSALVAATHEMGVILQRASYSTIVREQRDFSCAYFDGGGRLVSQAAYIPVQLGGMDEALSAVRRKFDGQYEPGDCYALNDPYSGAQHTPDLMLFTPVFYADEVVGFAGNVAHHLDMGGRVPGSVAGDSTEIFQEGLRIPPSLVFRRGGLDPLFESLLAANVRHPHSTFGDLRAQIAANRLGVMRVTEILSRHGLQDVGACVDRATAATEASLRARIAELPRGTFRGEDWVEDDGVGSGPLPIRVAVTANGDELHVDFAGTSPQARGPINSVWSSTLAAVHYVVRAVLAPDLTQNHGCHAPIRVTAPSGSLVNPLFPSACGGRMQTCNRIVDAMFDSLSKVVPARVTAGSCGNMSTSIGGSAGGRRFLFFEVMPGGLGARLDSDGLGGTDGLLSNCMNAPIEATETEFPLLFEQYELRSGSGGEGRRRGGDGLVRQVRLLAGEATLVVRGDMIVQGPAGMAGGHRGHPSRFVLNPGTAGERVLPSKTTVTIRAGDVLRRETAGGGGYGPGGQRQQDLIDRDLEGER